MNATSIIHKKTMIKKQKKKQKKQRQQKLHSSFIATHYSTRSVLTAPFSRLVTSLSIPTPLPTSLLPTLDTPDEPIQHESVSAAVIAAGMDPASSSSSSSTTNNNNKAAHIAGPIVGVFAGVAFIAAAMFLMVRNRKKRQLTTIGTAENKKDDTFHDISLKDEAITIPPACLKNRSILSTTTDYYSLTDTLIGSVRTKKQQSWQSSIEPKVVSSPTSTLVGGHHVNSFLMVAERQQLQHERPSILDHFDKRIETYKAQLADIDTDEEDDNNDDKEEEEDPLPFIHPTQLKEYYYDNDQ
ncbi:hypothetical protein INT47_009666 [Mucor saturninus]|uniref:Transmembrane protein n=1 Tax=Mucor saturninus TaxID=64648 RepID=A0A8H7UV36_9FUNG|nr:hypothetical protein INT47_009666 [Mucor saturninus]